MNQFQQEIPLDKLVVSDLNSRRNLEAGQEDSSIDDLAESIQEKGLLQPLTVRPLEDGMYGVIIGQRRLLACKKIGVESVSCIVRDDLNDSDALTISLVENVHRADMHPLDKANALFNLYEQYGSYQRVARETSWSAQSVSKYVSLLNLPQELRDRVRTEDGSAGVGTLSVLAKTFSGEDAVIVYDKISNFKQSIQREIIKQSEGDIKKIGKLVDQAMEGVFDISQCGGKFKCSIIKGLLEGEIDEEEFELILLVTAKEVEADRSDDEFKKFVKAFWKGIAKR